MKDATFVCMNSYCVINFVTEGTLLKRQLKICLRYYTTPGNSLCKYADDTYLIIPECNADSRAVEPQNIETWAQTNNLTLNRAKTVEVVFTDGKRSEGDR